MPVKSDNQSLNSKERWFALKTIPQLQIAALGIRLFGFNRMYRWGNQRIKRTSGQISPDQSDECRLAQARKIGGLVGVANRRIRALTVTCLPESLVVWWLVRHAGIPGVIRFGVRTSNGALEGHAWVEYQDAVISGDPELPQTYNTLDFMPGDESRYSESH